MTKPKTKINKTCVWCKGMFLTNRSIKKTCSKKCSDKLYDSQRERKIYIICRRCGKEFHSSCYKKKYCTIECRELERIKKSEAKERKAIESNKEKAIVKLSNCLSNLINKTRSCGNCGKEYLYRSQTSTGTIYCSDECKLEGYKSRSYRKTISKDKRITLNGKADYSINVKKLYKKDNGECHICNKQTDFKDYIKTKKGWFIAGNNYPSIDHVIPIAKGGLHQWDNVKLAHRICNSIKGDRN